MYSKNIACDIFTNNTLQINGLQGSSRALVSAAIFQENKKTIIAILDDYEEAGYFYNDLCAIISTDDVFFFPASYKQGRKNKKSDAANEILRIETLNRLATDNPCIVVTTPEAVSEQVLTADEMAKKTITLRTGENSDISFLEDMLIEFGFERIDFVYEPGQFSRRGSIIDIFSFSNEMPYRIDFFGDEVDSIRTFEVESQLSVEMKKEVSLMPDIASEQVESVSFFEFIKSDTTLLFTDFVLSEEKLPKEIQDFNRIEINSGAGGVKMNTSPQPIFHKNFDLVSQSFAQSIADGYKIYILSDSQKQLDRLKEILHSINQNIAFTPVLKTLHEGFIDHDAKICCYTDHQIFDRFHKYHLKSERTRSAKAALTIKELNQLQQGDYVTHIDHGIGRFGGLIQLNVNGRKQEAMKLLYRDDDIIMVNIHNLHRVSKYKGKEGEAPRINKLGSGAWQNLKERTKKKVKDIARDLIKLYAKRRAEQGFAFEPDSYLQRELEASFIYEDTPDQSSATQAVKKDMESPVPMDRLICGDVGFGKTEVAIRAAFKAATDGKQTAVLVPTTVLALQHFKTFSDRLKEFPCRVEYISRARKAADVKRILQELKEGKIDIIIGTHRIIGKDVQFKDLGLLIIDEEQKFGVSVKEKLKTLRVNVDTLTLTATPIPRTLQFSLMGARDLSVMTTPPPNRYPVLTELHTFDEDVIKQAIVTEMNRNGQVFFINNRVNNIEDMAQLVRRLVPEARVAVGNGQMNPEHLEEIILNFIDYEYDVLVATTIIESGIDIPNANTIIINSAQNFGLSDLHQLRGRVGRSNRKAYCYLLSPPLNVLPTDARRRLQAIETFAELGSGFHIAMQDLDIRGAGNMLGAEQSGFIADMGYETYLKILNEAVQELRVEELDEEQGTVSNDTFLIPNSAFTLESDLELMFPATYIESVSERMSLYRELDNIADERTFNTFVANLRDRFGNPPKQAEELLLATRLRQRAIQLGFEKLVLKNGSMNAYFVNNEYYFQSDIFGKVLNFVHQNHQTTRLHERNGKQLMSVKDIDSVQKAYEILTIIEQIT
ncbi:MAG: transcription-repair coupling factor [Prevotellaceae bacterium]|nr:transcription-repair coupling factor [Prevotellaceae bacterium]